MHSDTGFRHETIRSNGLQFHVAAAGAGERLALCLHGFPECWFSWRHQLPHLARLGYRAWAPDLRGYGRSERPERVEHYAIEELIGDVAGLIEAAGNPPTTLIGHDWGALIAWYFAMRRPDAIERLIIMNVPHPAIMGRAIRQPRQLARSWYLFFFQLPRLPEKILSAGHYRRIAAAFPKLAADPAAFPDEVLAVYRANAARPGALSAMIHYYRALVRGRGAARQRALGHPIIETPTLMIWGTEDRALGLETTYGTERWVRHLTLRYLPGVGHWVQQEAPAKVNALLEAWLQGRAVPEYG